MSHIETHFQKTCFTCAHWKQRDHGVVLWEIEPPDEYECEIWQIERHWLNPQAVIDAAFLGSDQKAEAIAQQFPSFSSVQE